MTVVVVEDHLMFREAVCKACREFGHEVVGETEFGVKAIELIFATLPDIAIIDLVLPDLEGFEVIKKIRASGLATRFLVLSCHTDEYTVFRALRAGICGFVDKSTNSLTVLRNALVSLERGGSFFSRAFIETKLERLADSSCFLRMLSETEQRVLSLIARGMSDDEIGVRLNIASSTAQTHRRNISQKLDVHGTPKLMAFAIEHGFANG